MGVSARAGSARADGLARLWLGLVVGLATIASSFMPARAVGLSSVAVVGGTSTDFARSIAVDAAGNSYVAGTFVGTADFDPGPGVANLTSAGQADVFIVKLDAGGGLVWARRVGGTDLDQAEGIAVDGGGNVYVVGRFEGTSDFNPGLGIDNLVSGGDEDAFVLKLDPAGNFAWARRVGGLEDDRAFGVALDGAANVYVIGGFRHTVDFDPGPGVAELTVTGGVLFGIDAFILKLSSAGVFTWVRQVGGTSSDEALAIAVDAAGTSYVTGIFEDTADFDPGPSVATLTSAGQSDVFVLRLDPGGNLAWARRLGGTSLDRGIGIAVDAAGASYAVGRFQGIADFGPAPAATVLTSVGGEDAFVVKFGPTGTLVWAVSAGGVDFDSGNAIAIDGVGNVYVTGQFENTADFDPGAGTSNLTSQGGLDGFVWKLDAGGGLVWARGFGGISDEQAYGIRVDGAVNARVVGGFTGTADFDPGSGTLSLTSAGNLDAFVWSIEQDAPSIGVPGTQGMTEDSPFVFSNANGNAIAIAAPDAGSGLRVSLAASSGTLTLAGTGGLSFQVGDGIGDPVLTFTGSPASVNAALNGLTLTPAPNAFGSATLQVAAGLASGSTGMARADTENVRLTIAPVSDPPTAADDAYGLAGTPTLVVPAPGILANDSDPDSAGLIAQLVSGPAHGQLALDPAGGFTYTAQAGYAGADSFTYRATSGGQQSGVATVRLGGVLAACAPRPRVTTSPTVGGGVLQVRIGATPLNTLQNNALLELRFGTLANAVVTVAGQPIASGQVYAPPPGTHEVTLTVQRAIPGQASTVPLVIVDGCGEWQTFVGAGTAVPGL
jgi:hypothetical protein